MDRSPRGFLGMTLRFRRHRHAAAAAGDQCFLISSLPSSHPFISLRPFSHAIMTAAEAAPIKCADRESASLPAL